tara:strand:+ start:1617 stop:1730 length:114 start_codon:yes stop_codon:yes gene_type:complete
MIKLLGLNGAIAQLGERQRGTEDYFYGIQLGNPLNKG